VKHWEIGLREPSAEVCEKLGALATTLDLADYWAECAGLPPCSGNYLQYLPSPLVRDAVAVPPTDAQTRMELHAGLDIILELDGTGTVRAFGGPLLVCVGDRDEILSVEEARGIADAALRGSVEVFPGAGHFLTVEQAERFDAVLLEYLSQWQT